MSWATTIFCPALGLAITNVMWLAPMKAVLEARKTKTLGELNPIPFAFTVLNCIGWVIYGLLLNNQFIFWSNVPGLAAGTFYSMNSMAILFNQSKPGEDFVQTYRIMEYMLLFACCFWSIVSLFVVAAYNNDSDMQEMVIGTCCMVFTISYYGAPLSTMYQVIKLRDSSSLYGPLLCVNATASTMWFIYGFAINDINIFLPNVIGASLAVLQLALLIIFYKKQPVTDKNTIVGITVEETHFGENVLHSEKHQSDKRTTSFDVEIDIKA